MLIIPLEKSFDWRRPPIVTLALILVNCFVLAIVQRGDDAALERAADFYLDSPLPEIEFPRYLDALDGRGEMDRSNSWDRAVAEEYDREGRLQLIFEIESDRGFMIRLRAMEVVTEADPAFDTWRDARTEFESLLRESALFRLGFIPGDQRLLGLFSYMFLHGGVAHLVGNMIFLFLVGFALEVALGAVVYLACYLVSGVAAGVVFWAVYSGSSVPLVGASGAIAGLMAMYSLLFGLRRIRFFYWIVVYFDYVRAPAIILFPLWLVNEIVQLRFGGVSNVAYVAHIGGLLAGGALGETLRRLPGRVDTEYLDESARSEDRDRRFEEGSRLLGSLQVDQARSVFRALHRQYPSDTQVLLQLYKADKLKPDTPEYHHTVRRVLALADDDPETLGQVHDTFRDYLTTTRGKPQLEPSTLLAVAGRFANQPYIESAEQILLALLRRKPDTPGLDGAILGLAQAWHRARDEPKYRHYLELLQRRFPAGDAAASARRALSA